MREAEITVDEAGFEAMGIGDLLGLAREAGIREFEELSCRGQGAVVQVELASRFDEGELEDLGYVDRWTHVAERDGVHVYVVSFTAPDLPERLEETAGDIVGTCDPDVDERGATMSLVGPHETIAEQIGEYEAAGAAPALRRIGGYEGPDRPLAELTDRQREVIETAWELGYYEVPRAVSADAVAAELDLDPSTVTEHLQRAERNLLGRLLSR